MEKISALGVFFNFDNERMRPPPPLNTQIMWDNQVISHSPDPLPQRTPTRGSKQHRNTSKNIDNYVKTHDAQKSESFTLDIQKFILCNRPDPLNSLQEFNCWKWYMHTIMHLLDTVQLAWEGFQVIKIRIFPFLYVRKWMKLAGYMAQSMMIPNMLK